MPISIVYIFILVGLALIVIALLGGGIEVKEIKIPALQIIPRIFSFFTGCAILALCFLRPDIFQVLNDNKFSSVPPPIVNPSPREFEPEPRPASPPTLAQPPTPVQPSTLAQPPIPVQPPTPAQPSSPPKPQGLPRSQTSWYVVLGSFDANNGEIAVSSAKRVKNKASEVCHVSAWTELTAKFEGLRPGFVSTLLGPYGTQKDAEAYRAQVRPCAPDAYLRQASRRSR